MCDSADQHSPPLACLGELSKYCGPIAVSVADHPAQIAEGIHPLQYLALHREDHFICSADVEGALTALAESGAMVACLGGGVGCHQGGPWDLEAAVFAFRVGVGVFLQDMDVILWVSVHEMSAEADAGSGTSGAPRNRAGFDPDMSRERYLVPMGLV